MTEETPAFEVSAQEALETSGKVYFFKGVKLEPFSFGRQVAAQRLQISGESTLEAAVLLIYLCTLKPERIDRARGEVETAALRLELNEWADRQGLTLQSPAAREAIRIANEIWDEIVVSSHEPDTHSGEPKKKSDPSPEP